MLLLSPVELYVEVLPIQEIPMNGPAELDAVVRMVLLETVLLLPLDALVAMILLIIAGAGTLKEILLVSGVSKEIASYLGGLPIHPLVLGWMMAAIIRVCLGSATIAGLTAAGMIYPLVADGGVNTNLMVLSIGAGSLMFPSHDTTSWS